MEKEETRSRDGQSGKRREKKRLTGRKKVKEGERGRQRGRARSRKADRRIEAKGNKKKSEREG